ncbi:uncharacterized protein LOC120671433 [Panicum virgatum]|uniref:Uncharacterized protein n=1 Tax=Panicum virgatum TaxID=38727 RepID=A0A8T0T296_PANVG|nr:uncharacterized protein LOC120671433 [Panicum virgatum]KAG2605281.1 hypothetical protein PVAP13_4NG103700 [Panicum virgatum]
MDAAGGGGAVAAGGGADDADAAFFSPRGRRCCGCFWAPPWAAASSPSPSPRARPRAEPASEEWWHRVGAASGRRRWWRRGVDALMKVREWSELVAGPRWKTFIRRLRLRRGGPRHGAGAGGGKLNYDPLSYALNFDDGGGGPEGDDDYAGHLDFSARFVAPPPAASARSSMDLGGRDAPPLFLHQAHSPRTPPAAARG